MEEFVGEDHKEWKDLNDSSQDPFIVVHGFRRLIAKQRRKALRKANNQRKKMLIPSASLADTFQEVEESQKNEYQLEESLWDVFNAVESNKNVYQLSFAELLVQSHQIAHYGEDSNQKSENTTSVGETSVLRRKIFAEVFVAFCYQRC